MLNFNLPMPAAVGIAALVPTVVGFIWYNDKVFGKAWLSGAGLTKEKAMEGFNMPLVFGVSLVLSFFLAFSLNFVTIHQFGFFSMMMTGEGSQALNNPASPLYGHAKAIFDSYGTEFRTFRHGAFHGAMLAIFTIFPIIATSGMFERKSWKYILINAGYWLVCLTIMGAIVCHFMPLHGLYQFKSF
jgi:hypothetical protein